MCSGSIGIASAYPKVSDVFWSHVMVQYITVSKKCAASKDDSDSEMFIYFSPFEVMLIVNSERLQTMLWKRRQRLVLVVRAGKC